MASMYFEMLWSSPYTLAVTFVTAFVSLFIWLGVRFDRQQQRKATEGIKDEPSQEKAVFENLPNFRQAGGLLLYNRYGQKVRDGLLYRSSRTDFLTDDETGQFFELGVKAIIDLRRNDEYAKADGDKILDKTYTPCILKKGKIKNWKVSKQTLPPRSSNGKDAPQRRRYMVNMMTIELIKEVFGQINFVIRYCSLLLLVVDWFFGCHLFVRVFSHLVSNHQTLAEQYVTMLEHTKPEVVDIMRLLLDDSNVPVLIHCAHGKDRTGVIVAMILGCLEVEDEVIVLDYSQSEAGLAPIKERLFRETVGKYGFKKEFTRATSDTMREVLAEVGKRYGSIPGYLCSAGFTLDEQQAFKDKFLEMK